MALSVPARGAQDGRGDMPNEKTTYHFGSVEVEVWNTGWQSSPWGTSDVFGATVHFMVPTVPPCEYFGKFYGSIHDAENGTHPVPAEVVAMVADELIWFDNDPDELTGMILEGVSVDTFDQKREVIDKLRASTPIAIALARWLEGAEVDTFEEWSEGAAS